MTEQYPMVIETITKSYVICPHCQKADSPIDHLNKRGDQVTWYCDKCGGRYKLTLKPNAATIEPLKEWCINLAVLLKYESAYVVVKGKAFPKGTKDNFSEEYFDYYYNEHTCPTNWMRVECLYDARYGDCDPHGMFEYIGYELFPEIDDRCNYDWEPLIKRIIEAGKG